MLRYLFTAVLTVLLAEGALTDTPANCRYNDFVGSWTFHEGEQNLSSTVSCDTVDPVKELKVTLSYPNVAIDQYGNVGTWTLVYNQGIDVTVNGRTYFAFSYYEWVNETVISYCDRTFPGWSHDVTVRHWACYYAVKDTPVARKTHVNPFSATSYRELMRLKFTRERQQLMVNEINNAQNMWKAKVYEQFEDKTYDQLIQMSGGLSTWVPQRASPAPVTSSQKQRASYLPKQWDWRDVAGVNYVPPVRDQGVCGSCFAFSSLGVLESRIRIQTNNTQQPEFSVQDVVSCSPLDQGCSGGFPYLIGGRYAKDYGLVEESCNPYQGIDASCSTDTSCDRHYTAEYSYVGGYYGATNEVNLQEALIQRGPLAVAFMVYDDFRSYASGIYKHVETRVDFDPLVASSHAVLLVGYGVDEASGEKYWTVKNSWGEQWGDNGYFKILRGVNECGIEAEGVEATPIPL